MKNKPKLSINMMLYKYYSESTNSFKSLSIRGLWCHNPTKMNDPADSLVNVDREFTSLEAKIFRDKFQNHPDPKLSRIYNWNDEQVTLFINMQRKSSLNEYAFCSLSETFDDILMWSHYASSHSGFVIGLKFDDNQIDHHFQKIRYTDYLPKLDIEKFADFVAIADEEKDLNYRLSDFSLKSSVWESEKEWRIWRRLPTYFRYEKHNIKKVFFGANCSDETKMIVLKLADDLNRDIEYHLMEFSYNPVKLIWK